MIRPALKAESLKRHFRRDGGLLGGGRVLKAVDGVDLRVEKGEAWGLVGETGCGKSTLGRMLAGLDRPTAGDLVVWARRPQYVFQDPYASLNPRKTVLQALETPLKALGGLPAPQRRARAKKLLDRVGLRPAVLSRYPHELSGGQCQRAALARALAADPELLILDEPLASLDVLARDAALKLLQELLAERELTYIFISHDLPAVAELCSHAAVMYLGRVVERGTAGQVLKSPRHPYTRALLDSVPAVGSRRRKAPLAAGEPPDPARRPPGCAFHPRCDRAEARCREEDPALEAGGVDRPCACFFAEDS